MNVTVTTAIEISKQELSDIEKKLEKKLGKNVTVTTVVDSSLIGGVALTVGSTYIDGSIRSKLSRVKSALAQ